jgi:ADP-ribose pyrophosphatase YjhB (NUDIX family)
LTKIRLASRGIIKFEWKILLVKHKKSKFWSLPWWKFEEKEFSKQCLERELFEELWVKAKIWKLISVNEFLFKEKEMVIEFFYEVLNWKDFVDKIWDFAEKELDEIEWKEIKKDLDVMPIFLKEKI